MERPTRSESCVLRHMGYDGEAWHLAQQRRRVHLDGKAGLFVNRRGAGLDGNVPASAQRLSRRSLGWIGSLRVGLGAIDGAGRGAVPNRSVSQSG